jgi:conjugal transfer/type IV secretion protein DotA/TraY
MNGAVTTASFNIPNPKLWPAVLEYVAQERRQHDSEISSIDRFNREMADGYTVQFDPASHVNIYDAEYDAYHVFETEDGGRVNQEQISQTGNPAIEIINFLFGTEGLFNIRENDEVHPLAQLSSVGKSLIESTIRNLGIAGILGIASDSSHGNTTGISSSFMLTCAMIGLTAGFALHYVIPFLPFLYFFFSVGGWIKGIFEAMVGVPLWALAHIRIDGQGLPGDAAANGYYLLFEIFLRPILMLFGLLGSILIFAALVRVLNGIFDLVTHNVGGFDIENAANPDWTDLEFYRNAIDEFFFTVIYTMLVYMLGVSSFKMVYLVPNQILRWMGASVSTFGDQSDDPTQGMMKTVAFGGGSAFNQMKGVAQQGGQVMSQAKQFFKES